MIEYVKLFAVSAVLIVLIIAGVFVPRVIWPAEEAARIIEHTRLFRVEMGRSRVPCRGPYRYLGPIYTKQFAFGYAFATDLPATNGYGVSGSICMDFNGQWEWRVDPPYSYLSSK